MPKDRTYWDSLRVRKDVSTETKRIKVISWDQEGSGEPASLYRLDQPADGTRFFRDLMNNAETDGREMFRIFEISAEDWAAAEARGEADA